MFLHLEILFQILSDRYPKERYWKYNREDLEKDTKLHLPTAVQSLISNVTQHIWKQPTCITLRVCDPCSLDSTALRRRSRFSPRRSPVRWMSVVTRRPTNVAVNSLPTGFSSWPAT